VEATAAGGEDSTGAVAGDFMEAAEQRFTGVEVSPEEATLGSLVDVRSADFMAVAL
jgi:hypothetical protein